MPHRQQPVDLDRLILARLQRLGITSEEPVVLGSFAPTKAHDLSPTASTSHGSATSGSEREAYSAASSVSSAPASILSFSNSVGDDGGAATANGADAHAQEFFATRSRVVRLYNLPALAEYFLAQVFLPHNFVIRTLTMFLTLALPSLKSLFPDLPIDVVVIPGLPGSTYLSSAGANDNVGAQGRGSCR
ncbi:hypothetical protein D9619_011770 [Psilocybe cf. subviscida]|uniref:Uncharacterized protein n=1 Tax=Psilocybe cf. subviscida TaxID=2480587 RepID=A0A8H5B084_9AGAR|nr:hypothetical protein D9619_011770 [Psilocybe cf. subviscida]